ALAGRLVRRSLSFSCISFLVFASNMALSLSTSSSASLIVSDRRASPRWKNELHSSLSSSEEGGGGGRRGDVETLDALFR
ncbi:hypothetical protein PENTCL1PPCAC_8336, partial [Pristionchus entomophagus]